MKPLVWFFLPLFFIPGALLAQELEARLQWAERLNMATSVSGYVTHIAVQAGDTVKQGDVLMRLDSRGAEAQLMRAEAQEHRLRLAYEEAQREFERTEEMYDRTLISQRELSLSEIALSMARAEHQQAKAELLQTRLELEYTQLTAPWDARVIDVLIPVGALSHNRLQAEPLIIIADARRMLARALVTHTQLAQASQNRSVLVRIGQQQYDAQVSYLGQEPLPDQPSLYVLEVSFEPSNGHSLLAGMEARIVLP